MQQFRLFRPPNNLFTLGPILFKPTTQAHASHNVIVSVPCHNSTRRRNDLPTVSTASSEFSSAAARLSLRLHHAVAASASTTLPPPPPLPPPHCRRLRLNPVVHEVADESNLMGLVDDGVLQGELDRLIPVHISGDLVPILKEAGAPWFLDSSCFQIIDRPGSKPLLRFDDSRSALVAVLDAPWPDPGHAATPKDTGSKRNPVKCGL
jgi:hypothetical protein